MAKFCTTYRVRESNGDHARYGGYIDADSWDEALAKAAELGQTVDGPLGAIVSCDPAHDEALHGPEVREFDIPKDLPGPSCRWDERITEIADALRTLRAAGHPSVSGEG